MASHVVTLTTSIGRGVVDGATFLYAIHTIKRSLKLLGQKASEAFPAVQLKHAQL